MVKPERASCDLANTNIGTEPLLVADDGRWMTSMSSILPWLKVGIKEADTAILPWDLLGAFRSQWLCNPRTQWYLALGSPLRIARL